jgi:hypothetical protein
VTDLERFRAEQRAAWDATIREREMRLIEQFGADVYFFCAGAPPNTEGDRGLMDEALAAALEDAIWQALDSEQGMPHSGVDPAYVIPEFVRLLNEAGYVIVRKAEGPK